MEKFSCSNCAGYYRYILHGQWASLLVYRSGHHFHDHIKKNEVHKNCLMADLERDERWVVPNGMGIRRNLNLGYVFIHVLEWSVWILNFLGAPIMTISYAAWVFGSISVVLYIFIIVGVVRTGQWRLLIPYFAIVFFILVTSLSISLGRMELGMNQVCGSALSDHVGLVLGIASGFIAFIKH